MIFKRRKTKSLEGNKPIISIITPYYNAGEYIEQTAKSVLNQTFSNFEWIIVDDGSSKEEKIRLKYIEKLDSRIKVLRAETEGEEENVRASSSKRFWNKKFCKKLKIYSFFRCR